MSWLRTILFGLAGVPVGAVLGVAGVYGVLALRGMTEDQGRRGLLAGVLGLVPGAIAGFAAGATLAAALAGSTHAWRGALGGGVLAVLLGALAFAVGMAAGIHLAESRGVTNYAGERAAWALFYVALPLTLGAGVGAFVLGRWLVG